VKKQCVLDAWAILALLQREEPAASIVKQLLENAETGDADLFISMINLGEVFYRVGKVKGENAARETMEEIRRLSLTIIPVTEEAVMAAAVFKMQYTISYADAFAVATAKDLEAILVTGDPELTELDNQIQIEKLERK